MHNNTISYPLQILVYFSCSVITYLLLFYFGIVDKLPSNETLIAGDSGFYESIKNFGYQSSGEFKNNPAFFPLFAYLWRIINLDYIGTGIFNSLLFLGSLTWVCHLLKPDKTILGFFMASPYLFFLVVPLSESLFFFLSVAIIYGIIKEKKYLIFVAVLLAGMTRPLVLFLIPAFVGMIWMSRPINQFINQIEWKKLLGIFIFPSLLGLLAVVLLQYYQTGDWWIYFEIQSKNWGRGFNYGPTFPLGYRTPYWNLNGSYFSFWIGTFTGVLGLKYLLDWFKGKEILSQIKNYELLSVIFICMSLMSILFFNASWMWNPDGEFMSTHFTGINRYIHPTVFFLILLNYIFSYQKLSWQKYLGIFLITQLLWFCFDLQYYNHIQRYLAFLVPNLIIIALGLYHAYRWRILGYGIILSGFILQSVLFNYYLSFVQVD